MKKLLVILILILVNQLSNESFQKSINERSGSIDTIVESSEIENELIAILERSNIWNRYLQSFRI